MKPDPGSTCLPKSWNSSRVFISIRRTRAEGVLLLPGRLTSILTREIFKELFLLFMICLGGFLSLLIVGKLLRMRDIFLVQGLSFFDLTKLFVFLSPFFLLLLLPIACMLSVFLAFLRMGNDREMTALRASGISLYKLLPGPVIFLVLCTVVNFGIAFFGLSWGMDNFRSTILELAKTKTQLVLQPGVFNQDFPGLTIYAQNVDKRRGVIETVLVQDRTSNEVTATIVAPEGRLVTDRERGSILFSLRDGRIYRQTPTEVDILKFAKYQLTLNLSKLIGGFDFDEKRPKEMSWQQLKLLNADPDLVEKESFNYSQKVKVELVKRIVLPMACLILGLFAMPLASIFQGLRQQYGLILALGCFLFYYTLLSIGLNLGEVGTLDPRIGLWIPNLVFFALTLLGLPFAVRDRSFRLMEWVRYVILKRDGAPSEKTAV